MAFNPHSPYATEAKDRPDARPERSSRGEKLHRLLGWMQVCYCVNCGKPKGMVTKDWAEYIFVLCDDCVFTHGAPPDAVELPEAVVQGPMGLKIGE
jgi:hypothetical protein